MTDREAAAASEPLPPLPQSVFGVNPAPNASAVAAPTYMVAAYTADQMREYVLADRRAAVSSASADRAMVQVPRDAYLWLMGAGADSFTPDREGAFWWRGAFNERAGLDYVAIWKQALKERNMDRG